MKDYNQSSLRNPADRFIPQVGENDQVSNPTSEEKASSIIKLASPLQGEFHDVNISSITLWTDDKQFCEKGFKINDHLKEKCKANISLIDKSNKIKRIDI